MNNPTTAAHPRTPTTEFVARVRMRDATPDDVATLVPLINDSYKARDGWLFGEQLRMNDEDLRDELDDEHTTGIVATIGDAVAGYAVVRLREGHAEFGLLAVDRAWQGQGLARLIVERAESIARDAGCSELRLECIGENNLPPFYEALGYHVTNEDHGSRWNSLEPFTLVSMSKPSAPLVARQPDAAFAASVGFRDAHADEAPSLAAMINEAYLREAWLLPPPRTTEQGLRDQLAKPHVRLIVAEVDGEVAGSVCAWLRDHDGHGPELGMLAVAPRFQGCGLAAVLIGEAERAAVDAGFDVMSLVCAKELGLPPFYASLGYEVVHEDTGMYLGAERPITKVTMRKELEDEGTSRVRPDGEDGDHHGR